MSDSVRVARVAGLLAKNPDLRFYRRDLVAHLSTPMVPLTYRGITRLWPEIELEVHRRDGTLYAVRPIGYLGYGVVATPNPMLALLSMNDREKNVITRLRNDNRGQVLQQIVAAGGQGAVTAALMQERIRAYLAAYEGQEVGIFELDQAALTAYRALPWASFKEGKTYASDNGLTP